jgi:hypothetical protein
MRKYYAFFVFMLLIASNIKNSLAQTAPATDPDAKDKNEVRFLAKKRIESDLQGLYNTLTFEDVGEFEREGVIKNSYLPSANQVFYSDDVLLEDDIDPKHQNANDPQSVKNWRVGGYLKELDLRYGKTASETVRFSNVLVSAAERKTDHYEVRVFFTSKFGGIYKPTKSYYSSTSRVATLRADKIDGKWQVFITQILFFRQGETITKPAVVARTEPATTPAAKSEPTPARPAPTRQPAPSQKALPGDLVVGGAEQEFYQPTDNAPVWFKWDLKAMQVVRSEAAQVPAGFFKRGGEKGKFTYYAPDSSRMVVQHKDTIRYRPVGSTEMSLLRKIIAKPTTAEPAPPVVVINTPPPTTDGIKSAPTTTTLIADKPSSKSATPAVAPTFGFNSPTASSPAISSVNKPSTSPVSASLATAPPTVSLPPTARVTTTTPGPTVKPPPSVSPGLNNTLKAEQAQLVKRYQTQGWLQLVAGVAGLVGGYLTYSSLQSDYSSYKAKIDKVNTEYDIWREVARQPTGQRLDPVSFNTYASPGIYAAYGAGLVGAGLAANGVLRFGKAKKVKKQVWK